MRRFAKTIISIAALGMCFSLAACGDSQPPMSDFERQTREIYESGLREGSIQELTYEEWLESIKGQDGKDGIDGKDGNDGHTPVIRIGDNGNWFIDDVDTGIFAKGPKGDQGNPGKDGISVVSIELTSSTNNVDTYTITYSNGTTSTFFVTNGEQGIQGIQGEKGQDGHTPDISISSDGYWTVDGQKTTTLAQGPKGDIGISIVRTHIDENGDLIIEYSDGSSSNAGHLRDNQICIVNFHVDDEIVATREVMINTKVSRPTLEETAGYTIKDWYYLDGSVRESWKFFGYVVSEDIDLYADFDYNEYTISFVDDKFDSVVNPMEVTYDHAFSLPILHQIGYTFSYWKDSNNNRWSDGIYRNASDTTLIAVWEANSYTVSLNPNGGSVDSTSISVFFDSTYVLPIPTRLNYIFLGWYDGNKKISNNATWKYSEDKSLIAKWTNVTNTYVFDAGDGTCEIESMVIGWEDEYCLPYAISDKYVFVGWFLNDTYIPQSGVWTYSNSGGILTAHYDEPTNYLKISDDTVVEVLPSFPGGNMPIPNDIVLIGSRAFYNCSSLISVTIPDSVIAIDEEAFYNCSSLISVTVGSNVLSIGNNAFNSCAKLVEVVNKSSLNIVANELSDNGRIGRNAKQVITDKKDSKLHDNCGYFTYVDEDETFLVNYVGNYSSFVVPDDVTIIGCGAFDNCKTLKSVTIGDGVTSIELEAFSLCSSLASVTIGENVKIIDNQAFYCCYSLASIVLGKNVSNISNQAFAGCFRLVEIINKSQLSISIGSDDNGMIGYYAKQVITDKSESKVHKDDDFITYIDGNKVYLIGYIGNSLSVIIPDGVTTIRHQAFYCSSITSVTIPNSVVSIDSYAFDSCEKLWNVEFLGTTTEWVAISKGTSWTNIKSFSSIRCSDGYVSGDDIYG